MPVTGWISLSPCCANKFGLQYNKLVMLIAREQIMHSPPCIMHPARTVPIWMYKRRAPETICISLARRCIMYSVVYFQVLQRHRLIRNRCHNSLWQGQSTRTEQTHHFAAPLGVLFAGRCCITNVYILRSIYQRIQPSQKLQHTQFPHLAHYIPCIIKYPPILEICIPAGRVGTFLRLTDLS